MLNPISPFTHFSIFLKNPEKSAGMYGEDNERQLCEEIGSVSLHIFFHIVNKRHFKTRTLFFYLSKHFSRYSSPVLSMMLGSIISTQDSCPYHITFGLSNFTRNYEQYYKQRLTITSAYNDSSKWNLFNYTTLKK